MAETVSLCLSYITESSDESLRSLDSSVTADDAINILKATKTKDGHVEAVDVSSLPYRSPFQWIEILSSMYAGKQEKTPKMDMTALEREPKKTKSVSSSRSFERGESSGTHTSTHKSTEAPSEVIAAGDMDRKAENHMRSSQSNPHEASCPDLGPGDAFELDVLIKRAFRLSVTDADGSEEFTRLKVAETLYTNKGKEPIRPTAAENPSISAKVDQSVGGNFQTIKRKHPLRSALKKSKPSIGIISERQPSLSSAQSDHSESRTMVQFQSHEAHEQVGANQHNMEKIQTDETGKSDYDGRDDEDSEDSRFEEEDQQHEDKELLDQLDALLKSGPKSAITVRPYTNLTTGRDVFLFNHGIVIPQRITGKLAYGVAIPGKIFRQKKNRYSSTFAYLIALSKANLDVLDIGIGDIDLIRSLILDDAEEAYRKTVYGENTWIGIMKERKRRYDPDTRSWMSIFYPSQWRRHGLVLLEGQNPPENSCKFRMVTLCGKVLYQWYVRCDQRRAFGPRNIIVKISCGEDDKCEKFLDWEPEHGPFIHSDSVKCWTEIDPDREGVGLPDQFYPFMKFWIIEGPPKDEPPPGCMKINCVTRCGLVKSRIRLLCARHISKNPKCIGGEFTMLINRGCALRDEIDRCDEKTVCEGYLAWLDARLGLPLEELSVKKANDLDRLHTTLVAAYNRETRRMGSFLKHKDSEKKWLDVIYNHVDYYEMLFKWGLRSIECPEGLSVVRADDSVLKG
ncbi:hypothetical protein TSTA_098730 [Talaromyces stipitatus ATCC 10500]|uniref:Uncharacterized protein n=1 Tax=Talaromyces stipitatus (strain ATCC 10500 / CBS 375.48 / QM 6759 / NRRL 1006) TaxID=441959 RepID=B8MMP9_TALSN|nr:uncharacterized protein TSTA_098730 [Talaromyces stipitatus ATCC 10500]EED13616.1 hypothetical protein TSTA_098730 [Talaromyces stipitatus ATCC 10500]